MRKVRQSISAYPELCKMKISFFSALSATAGFCAASSALSAEMVLPVLGVFVLACGSSALNQYQEMDVDARMTRTKKRPLPSGRIAPSNALYLSMALVSSGLILLAVAGSLSAAVLGICAMLWYNGVYTHLKRKTAFAVIPGALVGAIPPAIGWLLGGGGLKDPRLSALCFFFFMWQVPHFWVLLLFHGKEYETAGLPSLSGIFTRTQLVRITRHWMFATVVSSLLIFLYGLVYTHFMTLLLFTVSVWFVWQGIKLTSAHEVTEILSHAIFRKINYYMVSVIILISFDQLTGSWMVTGLRRIIQ
jgi:heme o synthase